MGNELIEALRGWTIERVVEGLRQRDAGSFDRAADALISIARGDGEAMLRRSIRAHQAMMDTWLDYHDARSLTQPVTGASNNAFDLALASRDEIEEALAQNQSTNEGKDER